MSFSTDIPPGHGTPDVDVVGRADEHKVNALTELAWQLLWTLYERNGKRNGTHRLDWKYPIPEGTLQIQIEFIAGKDVSPV